MKRILQLAGLAACVVAVGSCDDATANKTFTNYTGVLSGASEVPTVTTTATGTVLITVNEAGHLTYNVGWQGMSGAATGAHIHGPANATTSAAVIVDFSVMTTAAAVGARPTGVATPAYSTTTVSPFNGGASGTIKMDTTYTYAGAVRGDSLRKLLEAGLLYVNVHTAANAGGEIRAQVIKQ